MTTPPLYISAMEAKNQGRDSLALQRLRQLARSLGITDESILPLKWEDLLSLVEGKSCQVS
jgi:hypothetical protein